MLQNCYVIFDGGAPIHKIGTLSENNLYIQSVKGILSSILFIPNDLQYFQNHTTVHFDLLQQKKLHQPITLVVHKIYWRLWQNTPRPQHEIQNPQRPCLLATFAH